MAEEMYRRIKKSKIILLKLINKIRIKEIKRTYLTSW
jgi:hypothetical protein